MTRAELLQELRSLIGLPHAPPDKAGYLTRQELARLHAYVVASRGRHQKEPKKC